jgi:signal transduction histidine kinase
MNKSINLKLFCWFSLLIVIVILFIWLLNSVVLEKFYLYKKYKHLETIYSSINKIYSSLDSKDDKNLIEYELEKLDSNKNIDIVIRNLSDTTIYTSSRDFLRNKIHITMIGGPKIFDPSALKERLNSSQYVTEISRDDRISSDFVSLFGVLDNGYLIFIRTPLESIRESVYVSNTFLVLVGIVSIFLSSIAVLLISKGFTKPIKELNTIAKEMANLNFSQKYNVKTEDEIGMLGKSINELSEKLEKTITELKETNIELEKDVEETSKVSEMRNQFLSDVSHELKTPIALIQGYAEGLLENVIQDDESKKYYCNVILDEANKMGELTKDILDLSKLEYGNEQLNIEEFNITELITKVIKKNSVILNEKNINVDYNQTEELLVKGDVFRIEQVLNNYLNNAIEHIDENKIIKIYMTRNENIVRISLFNSGSHIDTEDIPRIWTRFYKVDSSRNRALSGSGLGLSVVKAIMNKHGNNYGVYNIEGGVEFWFELNS